MRGHQIRGETDRIPDELVAMFERKKKTLDSYKGFRLRIWYVYRRLLKARLLLGMVTCV